MQDYDFWCVAFKDEKGNDLYRQDANKDEIHRMKTDPDGYCKVWREFQTEIKKLTAENEILRRNVRECEIQLRDARIRIKDLTS